jgi:hypothetical protein
MPLDCRLSVFRWRIGWKKSNKLIESGSWFYPQGMHQAHGSLPKLSSPTAHTAARHSRRARILLRSVGDHRFRCHQQASGLIGQTTTA